MAEKTTPGSHACSSSYEIDAEGLSHWTESHADAWIGLLETHKQLTRALDAELTSQHGLSLSALELLTRLAAADDRQLHLTALAGASGLSLSRVSRVIDVLEGRKLVARHSCPTDARAVHAELTDAGLALVVSAQSTHFASVQAAFFDQLDDDEIVTLARVFGRFAPRAAGECDAAAGGRDADRGADAGERTHAEHDRDTAPAGRGASAREREDSVHDDLTGAYLRGAGFVELKREIARARRAGQPLVLAFVDVDHLKTTNDSQGHAAGDRMLREVAKTFKEKLRSHDLIIRYGGDEFVCAVSGLSTADATKRIALVNAALAQAPEHGSVTVGLAELRPDDSPEDLVARADAALDRERGHRRGDRA